MGDMLPLLFMAFGLVVFLGCCTGLVALVRRRGTAGSAVTAAMASVDEALKVTSYP